MKCSKYFNAQFSLVALINLISNIHLALGFATPGKFDFELNQGKNEFVVPSLGLYNQTEIELRIRCSPKSRVKIGWLLRLSECINEFYIDSSMSKQASSLYQTIYNNPSAAFYNYKEISYMKMNMTEYHCEDTSYIIDLYSNVKLPITRQKAHNLNKNSSNFNENLLLNSQIFKRQVTKDGYSFQSNVSAHKHTGFDTIAQTWKDGVYLFILRVDPVENKDFSLEITVSFKNKDGYLTAKDWPFLPFYGTMCALYSLYAIFWFIVSLIYFRDLLRIQFWIGGVIILGLMEKAAYLAEYDEINRNGYALQVAIVVAEVISCFKRTLARMLIIIVSLGFGIVKPRLGPTMQKVIALGGLYFVFSLLDAFFRIINEKEDNDSKGVLAGVPIVFIDVTICYWIWSNLTQTMKTLRLRRNIPKLTLYRHFSNTIIFCVLGSLAFMVWSFMKIRFSECLKDWKELWLHDAFWHILFSFILLVIIILWRPSKNSQRYAFTPLLDNEDDEIDETQETELFDSVKYRAKQGSSREQSANQKSSLEDDLKWVEENVPATLTETVLPGLIDSEEELVTTRMEVSKMD